MSLTPQQRADMYREAMLHSIGISLLHRIAHWLDHPDHEQVVRSYAVAVASEMAWQKWGTVISWEVYFTPLWQAVTGTRAALEGVLGVGWDELESAFRQRCPQPMLDRVLPQPPIGLGDSHTNGVTG